MLPERRNHARSNVPIAVTFLYGQFSTQGASKDISKKGLCLEIPFRRMQLSLHEHLHKKVSLEIDNAVVEGDICWFTLEESRYFIGICIDKQDRTKWKKIIQNHKDCSMKSTPGLAHA
ncbi:MAG: PilZ domain-containing protein [Deltaproteobacteria bacterium]|nr:PilZ domain-containing protein [Deltaproteobacteria bacterium]